MAISILELTYLQMFSLAEIHGRHPRPHGPYADPESESPSTQNSPVPIARRHFPYRTLDSVMTYKPSDSLPPSPPIGLLSNLLIPPYRPLRQLYDVLTIPAQNIPNLMSRARALNGFVIQSLS